VTAALPASRVGRRYDGRMDTTRLLLPVALAALVFAASAALVFALPGRGSADPPAPAGAVAWLDLVRIAAGLLLAERSAAIAFVAWYLPPDPAALAAALALTAGGGLLALGVATPLVLALLIAGQSVVGDALMHTSMLGSEVMQMVLVGLWLAPAGTTLSVDARLARRAPAYARLVGWAGRPTVHRLGAVRTLLLALYGLVALYSAVTHLAEPIWRAGLVNVYAMTSTFMGTHPDAVRTLVARWPGVVLPFLRASAYLTWGWELALLPLLLCGRWGHRLAVGWLGVFAVASLATLGLSRLPLVECLLVALVSAPPDRRLVGACPQSSTARPWPLAFRAGLATAVVMMALYGVFLVSAAGLDLEGRPLSPYAIWVGHDVPRLVGLTPISVFNRGDLRMSEDWTTVTALDADGAERLVPVTAPDGGRLWWQRSDRVYTGIVLPWRRMKADRPEPCPADWEQPFIDQLIALDRALSPGAVGYRLDEYRQPLPDPAALEAGRYEVAPATVRCSRIQSSS
jgi:hypothetical protein